MTSPTARWGKYSFGMSDHCILGQSTEPLTRCNNVLYIISPFNSIIRLHSSDICPSSQGGTARITKKNRN